MRPLKFGSTITVRLPNDVRELVEAAAEREDTSASDWVRRALRAVAASTAASASPSSPIPSAGAARAIAARV